MVPSHFDSVGNAFPVTSDTVPTGCPRRVDWVESRVESNGTVKVLVHTLFTRLYWGIGWVERSSDSDSMPKTQSVSRAVALSHS